MSQALADSGHGYLSQVRTSLNVTAGLLIPATVIGLARPSGSGLLVAGWYVGLTALTLVLAYAGHGLGRAAGGLIIAAYIAFVLALLAVS